MRLPVKPGVLSDRRFGGSFPEVRRWPCKAATRRQAELKSPNLCQSCFKAQRCPSMNFEAIAGGARPQAWSEGVQLARLNGCKAATRHQARFDAAAPAPKLLQGCEMLLREVGAQGRWCVAGTSQVLRGKQLTRGGQTMASQRAQGGSKERSRSVEPDLVQAPRKNSREGGALLTVGWWWCCLGEAADDLAIAALVLSFAASATARRPPTAASRRGCKTSERCRELRKGLLIHLQIFWKKKGCVVPPLLLEMAWC